MDGQVDLDQRSKAEGTKNEVHDVMGEGRGRETAMARVITTRHEDHSIFMRMLNVDESDDSVDQRLLAGCTHRNHL